MRKARALFLSGVTTALCGCVALPPDHLSVVQSTSFRDASRLTVTIADILNKSLNPPSTTLSVRPISGPDPMGVTTLLDDSLRERGFALAPAGMDYPGAHVVRYSVTPIDGDVELSLDVDTANATCVFAHDPEGALTQVGSCSVLSSPDVALVIPAGSMPHATRYAANVHPAASALHPAVVARVPTVAPPQALVAPKPTPTSIKAPAPPSPTPLPIPPTPVPALTKPVPIVMTWTLIEGQPLRDQMLAWGDRATWRVIWPREMNWMVPVTTSFRGNFDGDTGVLSQIVRALAAQGKPLRVQFFSSNHVALVTMTGAP